MTPEQFRLYTGMLRLFRAYGTGGSTWTGQRASGGTPAADPTLAALASRTIRFCQNNRVALAGTLPAIPIFTAPWWAIAAATVDVQAGDVYTNGEIAFLVTGAPDTSQGFLVIPSAPCPVPARIDTPIRIIAGFQAGLRIGAR